MKKGVWPIIIGIAVLLILSITYFIQINVRENLNSLVDVEVQTPLLGALIFHSPYVLALYIILAAILIFLGIKKFLRQ